MIKLPLIQRKAIDSSGGLGSYYDIYQDRLLRRQNVTIREPISQFRHHIECRLVCSTEQKAENLLKMINIDADLRLNILLDPKRRNGIAAFADYIDAPNDCTRFLYICYSDHEKWLPNKLIEEIISSRSIVDENNATHIIVGVKVGIDVAVVLKLPNDIKTVKRIDDALEDMQSQLNEWTNDSIPRFDDGFLNKITDIKVYSNFSQFSQLKSLSEIIQYIIVNKSKPDRYAPIMYSLYSIQNQFDDTDKPVSIYIPLQEYERDNLEQYLIEISNQMKRVKRFWNLYTDNPLRDYGLENLWKEMNSQWKSFQKNYEKVLIELKDLVFGIRHGSKQVFEISDACKSTHLTSLKQNITKLGQQINDFKEKQELIHNLKKRGIDYCNATIYSIQPSDKQALETKLIRNARDRVFCSSDRMKQKNESKWNQLLEELSKEQKPNQDLNLIYADFSYCSFEPEDMVLLPSNKQKDDPSSDKKELSSSHMNRPISSRGTPSSQDDVINILLLGESGVGKSTFVNAFVNYLTFQTLEEAEKSKPVVLIPVSFLLTVGKNFDEHVVNFGDPDQFNNEDFDHPGQSVTQHCKSYLFTLNRVNGRKIRIIDTPGFGDTRGVDQDDLNMQHILEYINNLTHVNAICFLLKPNVSEVHKFFKNCLTQIFDVLGPHVGANVVFCFTNCRTTFYGPGDTAPSLKKILSTFSEGNISFNKKNTFCFDNESFRYLVALQKQITFDNADKKEYENSWLKSVKESGNLLDYVCDELQIYRKQNTHQSIKSAQFQINHMMRPMLEAIRNILRNKILCDMKASNTSIELIANPLHGPATLCSICERDLIKKGKFWVAHAVPHEKLCQFCDCPPTRHIPIYYHIDYRYLAKPCNYSRKDMTDSINTLNNASVQFAFFLESVARSSKDDPFLAGMTHMIEEEDDICKNRKSTNMNLKLSKELTVFMNKYLQKVENLQSSKYVSDLLEIYKCILTVTTHPLIQPQMEAIKKTQEAIMKLYEYQVPENQTE